MNGGVPDVEIIYFISIEQKKEILLQILPGVLVITKEELIFSANKYLGKFTILTIIRQATT